jgi:hypothetical protein
MPNMARKRSDGKARPRQAMREEQMLAEIEDFIEGFNQPAYRGMRITGRYLVIPRWVVRGTAGPTPEWLQ